MKKLLLVGALALGGASCAPDISQDPPADFVIAEFDPSASPAVVPTPNDLAINPATGLVNAPIDPSATPAQQEFTKDYLNTLNGFPTSAVASTKLVDLDPTSVQLGTSVQFIDLLSGTPIATPPVTPTVSYDADTDLLSVAPPASGWPKGGRYAVALVAGDNGLKGVGGKRVVGSPVWAFASSENSLVTCEDLTAPDCRSATSLIPSDEEDPAKRIEDQTASALQLEQLRRSYKPLLDALATQGVERDNIVLLWTFRIMNMPEATFDPANSIIPFPNNILTAPQSDGSLKVALPVDPEASPLEQQLIMGLNTLDGFSTTAAIVSENSETLGAIDTGSKLDAGSLAAGTVFRKLTPGGTQPDVAPCLSCVGSKNPDGSTPNNPQQLQFVPKVPLDERSTYAAVMTTDLKDERGRFVAPAGAFALARLSSPLVQDGKSTVAGVSDANANALEPLRLGLKPLFDALAAGGLPRSKIALAWAFTTQSTVTQLQQLHALPAAEYGPNGLPASPLGVDDKTAPLLAAMGTLPKDDIGQIFQGVMVLPFALNTPTGTLDPTMPRFDRVPFLLVLPKRPEPTAAVNWPVAVFSHGLRGWHQNVLTIANELAKQGYATLAYDSPFHGERSVCVGSAAVLGLSSDDAVCAMANQTCDSDTTSESYGRCVAPEASRASCAPADVGTQPADIYCSDRGQGRCLSDNKCEGGTFLLSAGTNTPVLSGWNFLNLTNLFATRDNFRQHAIDLGQAMRVIGSSEIDAMLTAANAGTSTQLDETKIVFLGQSLGGILGTLSTSVAPNVGNVVLNVPGGDLTGILLTSPAFEQPRNAFLATLASAGITPGTPGFDQFVGLAKMILDPADPVNYAFHIENGSATPSGRQAFIQYIEMDPITPNPQTVAMINAANDRDSDNKIEVHLYTPTVAELAIDKRHGFLLDFTGNPTITAGAQNEAVQFLKTGTLP